MTRRNPPNSPAFDVLAVDRGWLTSEGIAHRAGQRVDTVDRNLYRWRTEGLVETRKIELTPASSRTEWKVSHRGHSL